MGAGTRSTLIELSHDECLDFLASEPVGRVAVAHARHAPLVVPVNYVVAEGRIRFRTGFGALIPAALALPVSFQVDRYDPATESGWSVLAVCRAKEISERTTDAPTPRPWVDDVKPYLVELSIRRLTGRRIVAA